MSIGNEKTSSLQRPTSPPYNAWRRVLWQGGDSQTFSQFLLFVNGSVDYQKGTDWDYWVTHFPFYKTRGIQSGTLLHF